MIGKNRNKVERNGEKEIGVLLYKRLLHKVSRTKRETSGPAAGAFTGHKGHPWID